MARLRRVSIACALVLQACGGGGGGDKAAPVVTPSDAKTQTVASGTPAQVSITTGGVLQAGDASAQVKLPANAMVDAVTGAAVTGEVTVTLSTINPAADPQSMVEGSYEAIKPGTDGTETELIESFGAITVTLNQGDRQLQLAKGKTATIRIPVQTRAAERPAEIPLYYWDDKLYVWIQEGSAKLQTDAATGKQYYEGTVSHFTTWNADKPIDQSVKITGCVQATPGVPADDNAFEVYSDGQDYSGLAWGTNSGGRFTVLAKKGGTVTLHVRSQGLDQTQTLKAVTVDTDIKTCFVLSNATNSTPKAFYDLISAVATPYTLVLQSSAAVDTSTALMLAPSKVCQSGSVSDLTLNAKAVNGGEPLLADTLYKVNTSFKQCLPEFGDLLNGQASLSVSYTGDIAGNSTITATSTLNALRVSNTFAGYDVSSTGIYDAIQVSTATQDSTTVTPKLGAQLTNVATGRTLSFTGGSEIIRTEFDAQGDKVSDTLQLKQLTYQLNGATYVLNGTLVNSQGVVTLTKNGQLQATLTVNDKGQGVTGIVDPF
jgi:hypothetical protein